ncbi:TGF-beta-activated kinase 1 and MAP3K7-binding protein 1 isoform X1 [Sus scrofa]|uniref:TGF-beta-activated kinase 1 and MAP3K7-binding protein 1 isoform X1 n=1 Tax=Sus scrofa TaxID=9823 RepID=UPI000A2B9139|nr:TGF-beta-activated kinase 1 and MAP3K7-binding protein 1 isoform X1 [Sus scrofa]
MAAQRRSLLQSEQQPSWTDDLPLCHLSGVGSASNRSYSADGKGTESHPPEDNWLKFRSENNCFLYGVFNGYDGNRVTNFVAQRLSAELLLGQLSAEHTEADVRRVLLQAFDVVERSFLESIDDALAEKASLQSQLPEGVPQHQLPPQYQKILERLKTLEREVSGGAMAVVAVLLSNRLYVANVGTNRALLCKSTVDGLQVTQLNMDHTTENEDELFRLSQLGLDAGKLKQVGVICGQESTRRIGDYKVKYGYTDIDLLSAAKSKPIIAEPEIHGAQPLDGVTGFLVLMSEGLYKALEAAHGPGQANQEIAAMIDTEFAKQTSLDAVAQAVVDRVKRIHSDTFASGGERAKFCPRHEDMTLLVRNFGYPLGELSQPTPAPAPAAGGRVYPVSVPYSSTQSTSKTSVTLSLVMPSQGQLVNGAHSASTLDEATPTLTKGGVSPEQRSAFPGAWAASLRTNAASFEGGLMPPISRTPFLPLRQPCLQAVWTSCPIQPLPALFFRSHWREWASAPACFHTLLKLASAKPSCCLDSAELKNLHSSLLLAPAVLESLCSCSFLSHHSTPPPSTLSEWPGMRPSNPVSSPDEGLQLSFLSKPKPKPTTIIE